MKNSHKETAAPSGRNPKTAEPSRASFSRRKFMTVSAAFGATILTGKLSAAAQEKSMKKTFTILHTNDMHSNFIGMAPSSDYTPFTLNDDRTRGGWKAPRPLKVQQIN